MTELECRKILGLSEAYTLKEAKQAYRKHVLETHPDRNHGDNTKFILVNKAFDEIQRYLEYKNLPYTHTKTKQTYQRRTQADLAYKTRIKNDLFWRKYNEARKIKYENDFKENLKFGFLIIIIIVLLCIIFGKDPEEYTRRNSYQSEYE